jgi:hypothetical protein
MQLLILLMHFSIVVVYHHLNLNFKINKNFVDEIVEE